MSKVPEFTVVLGVDAYTLPQLKLVLPTWRRHKPSLFNHRLVVFYDKDEVTQYDIYQLLGWAEDLVMSPWPVDGGTGYRSREGGKNAPQRAMMLAGFVHVPPAVVTTPYFLKIDTDAVATGQDDWIRPEWFDGNPPYIAPPWGYTVGENMIETLDDWGDTVPSLRNHPRLDLPYDPASRVISHPRMCSWCSFYNTAWSREVASWCPPGAMPVNSQDTTHWYCATRGQTPGRHVNMKAAGWQVVNARRGKLEAAVAAAMGAANV